jgi:nucleoside-diphosphate-sugar epimerase
MSVYGEGRYLTIAGEVCDYAERDAVRIRPGDWDLTDRGGAPLRAIATPEEKLPSLRSVYALNTYAQERMSLLIGEAYGIPTIALRLFNVYGTRQALSNPHSGVLAIFAAHSEACVRASDTVARLGGDEFALILTELRQPEHAATVARKAMDVMAKPFRLDGQEIERLVAREE